MPIRRRQLLGAIAMAVAVAACSSGTGGTASPASAAPATIAPASSAPASSAPASEASASAEASSGVDPNTLAGFCADFASRVATAWPNIDQSNAIVIGPLLATWASVPELATVSTDLSTVFQWVTTASIQSAPQSPPPDVNDAFTRIKAFADANC